MADTNAISFVVLILIIYARCPAIICSVAVNIVANKLVTEDAVNLAGKPVSIARILNLNRFLTRIINLLYTNTTGFEELYCECGASVMYPPIPCGTKRPHCTRPCTRQHDCDHESLHSCHSQPECPPCTVLTAKICYGGHEVYTILNSLCLERKTQRNIVKQARYI